MRTLVHLVRHGEVHNPDGILYGRLPGYGLSERGREQALRVAEHLSGADATALLVSPMQRAQETAVPIAEKLGLEVVTDDRLIEAANAFEGRRVAVGDGALRKPEFWPLLRNPFRPSWGEPYIEIAHRMLGAAHRARALAEGHEAVCVSHQLPIWTLRRYLAGDRLWHNPSKRQCALGSVTSLVFDDESLVDIAYAEPSGTSTGTGA
ncbi:histidine phosphatase family protein [Actinomycetospora termitidis]|uniref:Histidine phosphatase family protein n=1 Tax=Actinomycetospora termitidis TaxID=3053470 RepID=A0ABT7M3T2_9PSEU|nr:histidine phosphatase family protein [Actinomycetospora sp. Odt1-22]MDL5155326.1 histidine phosphatase family protein [Actinomycetospora sp. Odt1-22]